MYSFENDVHYREYPCHQNRGKIDDFIAILGPINCGVNGEFEFAANSKLSIYFHLNASGTYPLATIYLHDESV
jgi:hypothetical protein